LLGQGKGLDDTLKEVHMVVEGVVTARAAMLLAKKYNAVAPIVVEVNKVLFDGKNPKQAVQDLMTRDKTVEYL
jgi:glycerol-3-phosphate dehydrogenase (NAD(P)+)